MLFRDRAVLPDSKTGPQALWLGKAARKVLAEAQHTSPALLSPDAKAERLGHALDEACDAACAPSSAGHGSGRAPPPTRPTSARSSSAPGATWFGASFRSRNRRGSARRPAIKFV